MRRTTPSMPYIALAIVSTLAASSCVGATPYPLPAPERPKVCADVVGTGWFVGAAEMHTGRFDARATLLASGLVLVTGGWSGGVSADGGPATNATLPDSAELYDPLQDTYSEIPMLHSRRGHHAVALPDSDALIIAGNELNGSLVSLVELFNHHTLRFEQVGTIDSFPGKAILLPDGDVLLLGGSGAGHALKDLWLYHARLRSIEHLDATLNYVRSGHLTATVLDTTIVVVGGAPSQTLADITTEVRRAAPPFDLLWSCDQSSPTCARAGTHHGAVRVRLGESRTAILFPGGWESPDSAQLFDGRSFSAVRFVGPNGNSGFDVHFPKDNHLPLAIPGNWIPLNPAPGTNLPTAHDHYLTAPLEATGQALVLGGVLCFLNADPAHYDQWHCSKPHPYTFTTELFNPADSSLRLGPPMISGNHYLGAATALQDGRSIFVVGGGQGLETQSEKYAEMFCLPTRQ